MHIQFPHCGFSIRFYSSEVENFLRGMKAYAISIPETTYISGIRRFKRRHGPGNFSTCESYVEFK